MGDNPIHGQSVTIRIVNGVGSIDKDDWNRLAIFSSKKLDNIYNPFLTYNYFNSLEKSNSASRETGWLPQHLVLEDASQETLGILPCYLKSHSQGEYVFDHGWADAFERAGGNYYPKLQATVPFTPASGSRFLVGTGPNAEESRLLLAGGLQEVCEQLSVSSAHLTFMEKEEWELLGKQGFLQRTDQQFHWLNDGYDSFDQFLDALSSRKRKNIRKERANALRDNGISIEWLTGSQLS